MRGTIEQAAAVMVDHSPTLAFTGAGISTGSGIPDFRGPDGLWTRMDPADFTIERYLSDPARRLRGWQMHLEGSLWGARAAIQPNAGHLALVDLWKHGLLAGCITQNVDGLHLLSGLPEEMLAEVHGNVRKVWCLNCHTTWPTEEVLVRIEVGQGEPFCTECGGIIKTTTVMFGEQLPVDVIDQAWTMSRQAGSVLVVGSTLSVWPVAEIPLSMAMNGQPLIIVNQGPTEMDHIATIRLEGNASEVLPELVGLMLRSF